jgi:hypothetical protein
MHPSNQCSRGPVPRSRLPPSVDYLVASAIERAAIDPLPYSAHSLRAGFVAYAHLRGASSPPAWGERPDLTIQARYRFDRLRTERSPVR